MGVSQELLELLLSPLQIANLRNQVVSLSREHGRRGRVPVALLQFPLQRGLSFLQGPQFRGTDRALAQFDGRSFQEPKEVRLVQPPEAQFAKVAQGDGLERNLVR